MTGLIEKNSKILKVKKGEYNGKKGIFSVGKWKSF